MSWAMVGAAGISVVGGLFGSKSAAKTQKEAIKLQREQLAFNKEKYADYKNQYSGINDLVIGEAEKGVTADLGRVTSEASADTATAFKNAQTALDNQNQRMGINPNSGRAESNNRQLALSQAIATAGSVTNARNSERKNANDQTWNRRYAVYGSGLNLVNSAANSVDSSSQNLASAYGNLANNQQSAANSALSIGASLGMQAFQNYQANKPTTTTIATNNIDATTKGLKLNGTDVSSGVLFDSPKTPLYQNQNNGSFLG